MLAVQVSIEPNGTTRQHWRDRAQDHPKQLQM
jgi:hypothetical protein